MDERAGLAADLLLELLASALSEFPGVLLNEAPDTKLTCARLHLSLEVGRSVTASEVFAIRISLPCRTISRLTFCPPA